MSIPLVNGKPQDDTASQDNRVFVILNPVAGLTDANVAKDTISRFCEEHHWQCDIHETKKDEDLRQLVREQLKKGVDIVIAAGGDGTVSAVVSGMVNSKKPMAILPAGTGNALARDLSIPLDMEGALGLLNSNYAIQEMDIMEVSAAGDGKGDYYALNVSVGITSQTMGKTGREEKRRFGFLAYIYNAIQSIWNADMVRFQIRTENKNLRIHASEVMIANTKFMGLQPQIDGVTIDINDGRLDMFIIRTSSLRGYLSVLTHFILRRKAEEDSKIRYLDVHEWIDIKADHPMAVQADGEVIGKTPVKVRLVPGALRVIVPSKEKNENASSA